MSWLDKFFNTGYATILISGVALAPERTLNLSGAVSGIDNPTLARTDVSILSGGYTTIQNAGTAVAARAIVNFIGAASVVDNAGAARTDVTLTAVTFGGDLSGSSTTQTVLAIQGNTVSAGALTKGQFFVATSTSNWAPTTLSGDISESAATAGLLTVTGLQGRALASTAPTSNQVLTWNNGASQWQPATPSSGFTAGGDLSGTSTSQTVIAIQGNTVSAGALTKGQFFVATSTSNWAATTLSGDIAESASTAGLLTVTGLQGRVLASTAPTNGQAIVWNNGASQWQPSSVSPTGSASGSLGGSYPGPTVVQVDGSGSTNDFGGAGATCNVVPTETILGSSTTAPVFGFVCKAQTTDGTTWVTIATLTPPTNTTTDWVMSLVARNTANNADLYRADVSFTADREGGNVSVYPSSPAAANIRTNGAGNTWGGLQVITSSATWSVQVKGLAATTINWSAIGQGQRVS